MTSNKKSFLLHIDSLGVLDDLTDEQAGMLFKAIKSYQTGGEPETNSIVKIAFSPFKNQFVRDDVKYKKTCEARSKAGSIGGIKSKRRGLVKKNNENSFYIIKCFNEEERFIKAGITMTTLSRRYSGTKAMPYEWEIIEEFICETSDSIALENMISDNFDQYNPNKKFGGYLECYNYNDLDKILAKVSKSKQNKTNQADNKTKNKNKTKSDSDNYIKDLRPDGLNCEAWDLWIAFRAKCKFKKYKTDSAMKKLITMGNEETQALIIQQSINNEYQGLFPIKQSRQNQQTENWDDDNWHKDLGM